MDQATTLFWAQLINSVIQGLSLIFLIIYVVKTWQMASATRRAAEATERTVYEMGETRDQESAPNIVTYFDIPTGSHLLYLVIKNLGKGIATNVKMQFNPPLLTSDQAFIGSLTILTEGIASMPPTYEVRTLLDTTVGYFGDKNLPLRYTVRGSYYGGIRKDQRTFEQILDLSIYKGLIFVQQYGTHDLTQQVKELVKEHQKVRKSMENIYKSLQSGVFIKNASLVVTCINAASNQWHEVVIAKLREFSLMWLVVQEDRETGIHLSNLQTRFMTISEQLIVLVANQPNDPADEHIDMLIDIAARMRQLGRMTFYMDGGRSIEAFNQLGNSVSDDILVITMASKQGTTADAERNEVS